MTAPNVLSQACALALLTTALIEAKEARARVEHESAETDPDGGR